MKIQSYKLIIPGEIEVTFLNYGGIIQSIIVPDQHGKMDDIVLGFDHTDQYQKEHPYFGALIGRYANRIARGTFSLEGKNYQLPKNNGPNSLHGGIKGLDKVFWEVHRNSELSFSLSHISPDGDEGYPGKLCVQVSYTITKERELVIDYKASSDQATPVNLTNHSYFNLGGKDSENILNHELYIDADSFTEVDKDLTPTGKLLSVTGPMDFRVQKSIGQDIAKIDGGYDHNFVLNNVPFESPKARVVHPDSGRVMEVFTTTPGLQFYSGNFLDGSLIGKAGKTYQKYAGLCLETQYFPDSPNHLNFPDTILRPGEKYISKTVYKFS